MKMKACVSIAVALALLVAFVSPCFSAITLGLSVNKPNVTVEVGKSSQFPVGRIYNVGNNSIWVTSVLSENNVSSTLFDGINVSLTVLTPNVTLNPGDSCEVLVEAYTAELGVYSGQVNLQGHGFEPVGPGNPVLPGGTLPFNLTVTKAEDPDLQSNQKNLGLVAFIICAVVVCVLVAVTVVRRSKRKQWTRGEGFLMRNSDHVAGKPRRKL